MPPSKRKAAGKTNLSSARHVVAARARRAAEAANERDSAALGSAAAAVARLADVPTTRARFDGMPARNKRPRAAVDREARAAAAARQDDAPDLELDAAAPEQPAAAPANLADVLDTEATFDVADVGSVVAITTYLTGALIGRRFFDLNNSAWPGYAGGTSKCAIDGYVDAFEWPSGPGVALIVRTVDDGYHYAFRPDQILPSLLPARARINVEKEIRLLKLRARLARGFDGPPAGGTSVIDFDFWLGLPTTHSALDPELRRLLKLVWYSERVGRLWDGPWDQVEAAYRAARDRLRARAPQRQQQRQQLSLHERAAAARSGIQGRQRASRAARNAHAMLAYDVDALADAAYVDLGRMGACASCDLAISECTCDDHCQWRMCTHCGALLFKGEAKQARVFGSFNTCWHGGDLCCSGGKVRLPPIRRVPAIEALWNDARLSKTLVKFARQLNNALTLASAVVKTPKMPGCSHFQPSVVIQGKLHHKVGALMTSDDAAPQYAQLYVHDPAASETTTLDLRFARLHVTASTSQAEVQRLKDLLTRAEAALRSCNPYVRDFVTAGEIFKAEEKAKRLVKCTFVLNPDKAPRTADKRVYSANRQRRTFDEVTVLHNEAAAKRAVVLRCRDDDSELGLHWTPIPAKPTDGQPLRDPPMALLTALGEGTLEFTRREYDAFGIVGLERNSFVDVAGAYFKPAGCLRNIHEDHRAYDPIHYVLLFPAGDDGWVDGMPHAAIATHGLFQPIVLEHRVATYHTHTEALCSV